MFILWEFWAQISGLFLVISYNQGDAGLQVHVGLWRSLCKDTCLAQRSGSLSPHGATTTSELACSTVMHNHAVIISAAAAALLMYLEQTAPAHLFGAQQVGEHVIR